ncbi:GAF domain-containing protein [Vulcaniibacterium tengchongense]|uniref:GAF domain-containing protein n=1 Tax=Vulcaniibacterium tengchongense TaxID=1273429 RepID=A0A3N4VRS9_9GAMM|nr:GAF domain-containing protein [Vulcaniibacterium tengchongense]RPE79777.1 GAF domain-containing protein [Vulcaniibacterium tengchongense]
MPVAVPPSPPAPTPAGAQRQRLRVLLVDADPARRNAERRWLESGGHEVHVAADVAQALALGTAVIPSVLVADVAACYSAPLVERLLEELAVFEIGVVLLLEGETPVPEAWADYVQVRRPFTREQLLECVARTARPIRASGSALRRERQRREEAETLLGIALDLTSRVELHELLQRATDAARELTGAAYAAFFYNCQDEQRGHYRLYTLSGAPREAFDCFGMPRNTPLFAPTFAGERIVRSDDVLREPLYGRLPPHHGMPAGHLPVRSYLAVPVVSRSREVFGGLFFGHPEPAMFTQRAERLAVAVAAQAAVAIGNSRRLAALRGTPAGNREGSG